LVDGNNSVGSVAPFMHPILLLLGLSFLAFTSIATEVTRIALPPDLRAQSVAVGSHGELFVAGSVEHVRTLPGATRAFAARGAGLHGAILKMDADGRPLRSAAIGRDTYITSMAVAPNGDVLVLGSISSPNLPRRTAFQSRFGGSSDAFLARFDARLSRLRFATYIGSPGPDYPGGLAVDAEGNAYVGVNLSSQHAYHSNTVQLGDPDNHIRPTVFKVSPRGALLYSAQVPGETITSLAVNTAGEVVVGGHTVNSFGGSGIQVMPGASGGDVWVVRLAADGSHTLFARRLGGAGYDILSALAVRPESGNMVIAGQSYSTSFGLPPRPTQQKPSTFIAELNGDGELVRPALFSPHRLHEEALGVAVTSDGQILANGVLRTQGEVPGAPLIFSVGTNTALESRLYQFECAPVSSAGPLVLDEGRQRALFLTRDAAGSNALFSLRMADFDQPEPLSISLLSPGDGAVLDANTSHELTAAATGGDDLMVQFFDGETLLGTITNRPFSLRWTPSATAHFLQAKVTQLGTTYRSCAANVTTASISNATHHTRSLVEGVPVTMTVQFPSRTTSARGDGANEAWWEWRAPHDGVFHLEHVGSNPFLTVKLHPEVMTGYYRLAGPNGLTFRATQDQRFLVNAALSPFGPASGPITLRIRQVDPPANDRPQEATVWPPNVKVVRGTTRYATHEPDQGGNSYIGTVWYRWRSPDNGIYRLTLNGAFDSYVEVFQSPTGEPEPSRRDLFSSTMTGVLFEAAAGGNYWFRVVDFLGTNFSLQLQRQPSAPNDLFENATALPSLTNVSVQAETLGAWSQSGEPDVSSDNDTVCVWWTWTAPADGACVLEAQLPPAINYPGPPRYGGPDFRIYRGESLNSMEELPVTTNPKHVFKAQAGVTYRIAFLRAYSEFTLKLRLATRPPNDDFANATQLVGGELSLPTSTAHATAEPGETANTGAGSYGSVWYRWTPPSNGTYVFSSAQGGVELFRGTTFADLQRLSPISTRSVLHAVTGEEVYIRVGLNTHQPNDWLSILPVTPPPNDNLTNAEPITTLPAALNAHLDYATLESFLGVYNSGPDVWFTFIAPSNHTYILEPGSPSEGAFAGVYTQYAWGYWSQGYAQYGPLFFEGVAGTRYFIAVTSGYSSAAHATFRLSAAVAAPNDDRANAIALTGAPLSFIGSNYLASLHSNEPVDAGYHSVWYTWTAPQSGTLALRVSPLDITHWSHSPWLGVALFRVDEHGGLLRLNHPAASALAAVTQGQQYYIAVASYPQNARFRFHLDYLPEVPNDHFANRSPLLNGFGRGTLRGATGEPGEPFANTPADPSAWWEWAPSQSGWYQLRVMTDQHATPTVFTGESLEALQHVPFDDNAPTTQFYAEAGSAYLIRLATQRGAESDYLLRLTPAPRAANDHFTNRTSLRGAELVVNVPADWATREPEENVTVGQTKWWTWTAPSDGTLFAQVDFAANKQLRFFTGESYDYMFVRAEGWSIALDVKQGEVFQIQADELHTFQTPHPWRFRLKLVRPPSNDTFERRRVLRGLEANATGTHIGATAGTEDPWGSDGLGHTTWWEWTAPRLGRVVVRLQATNSLSRLDLFRFRALSSEHITTLECNPYQPLSEVGFLAEAGERFVFVADGTVEHLDERYHLSVLMVPAPANDLFENRADLVNGFGQALLTGASGIGDFEEEANPAVWWRLSPASNGWHTLASSLSNEVTHALTQPDMVVFQLREDGSMEYVSPTSHAGSQLYLLHAGIEYAVRVSAYFDQLGVVRISAHRSEPPTNDDFAQALDLGSVLETNLSSLAWSTWEPWEAPWTYDTSFGSTWFRWTPPAAGSYLVSVHPVEPPNAPHAGDAFVHLFTGTSVSNLTLHPWVELPHSPAGRLYRLESGEPVMLQLNTRPYASNLLLRLAPVTRPENDDFTNRVALVGYTATLVATNHLATPEPGDPLAPHWGTRTVWWKWTAPASGTAQLTGEGYRLGVFTGDWLTNLVPVTSLPRYGTVSTFPVQAGVEYQIGWAWAYYESGPVAFTLTHFW
jgi:hypothetical protein